MEFYEGLHGGGNNNSKIIELGISDIYQMICLFYCIYNKVKNISTNNIS